MWYLSKRDAVEKNGDGNDEVGAIVVSAGVGVGVDVEVAAEVAVVGRRYGNLDQAAVAAERDRQRAVKRWDLSFHRGNGSERVKAEDGPHHPFPRRHRSPEKEVGLRR